MLWHSDLQLFLKKDSTRKQNTSGGGFWQTYHSTIKSAGVFVLWFCASTFFWMSFYLLSRDKTISSLLELIDHVLSIYLFMFWKKLMCFQFWWKTYTQSVAQIIRNITRQKTYFTCTLQWINCFQFQKKKYWIRNMAVKIPILIFFRCCLLC